ncbi:hypothetical protein EYB35_07350 [Bacillus paranthracis]|nr:hypothetical protein EYB35_07350 [Bacillus paranthracis]
MEKLDAKEKVSLIGVLLGSLGDHQKEIDQDLMNEKIIIMNDSADNTTPKERRETIKKVATDLIKSL